MAPRVVGASFVGKHADSIQGVISCFDRVILRGHLPLSYPKGMSGFLYQQKILLKDLKDYAPRVAERVKEHVKAVVQEAGAPYRHLPSEEPMEKLARQMVEERNIQEGIVCGFSQMETCRSFRFEYVAGKPRLRGDFRKCLVLYVFMMHAVLGLIHVKIQTWLPLTMQVYVNGHDFLAKKLDALGVKYTLADNALTWVEDIKAAQACADRFAKQNWPRLLGALAQQFNPLVGRELRRQDYYWVVDQAEYATDVLFKDAAGLAGFYPRLVEHARACFSAEDVFRFLGRKLTPQFAGEVHTHVGRRIEGVRVKHALKANKLKMYDKAGSVLRVEMTINAAREFRVRRAQGANKEMAWQPLRKGVAWLWRFAEVSRSANHNYLEALAVVDDDRVARKLLDRVTKPAQLDGQRKRALQPLSPADQALFVAVLRGEHRVHGFRNRDLSQRLYAKPAATLEERRRRCARVTRLIRLLRAHHLVAKVPRTRRYRLTAAGERLMSAAIVVKAKHFPKQLEKVA